MSNLSSKVIRHELVEKFLDNKQLAECFESLCNELVDKIKHLSSLEKEKIQKSAERVYKAK